MTFNLTSDDIKKIIKNIRERVDDIEKHTKFNKYYMDETLGLVILEYILFGGYELEDIAKVINEALIGVYKGEADSNEGYTHIGKLVLEK